MFINDNFFNENNGSTIVHFIDGKPFVKDDNDFEVEIGLNVSDFASLIMGVVNFKSLYKYRLINISDEKYIDIINKLFLAEDKPICMTAF